MNIIQRARAVAGSVKKLNNAATYQEFVALEGGIFELTCENKRLEEKVAHLEALLKFKETVTLKGPLFSTDGTQTPFCPMCWEVAKTAVHLTPQGGWIWTCKNCKENYPQR